LNWARDSLGLISNVEQIDELCATSAHSTGIFWIPAQTGLGAPYWDRAIRGAWLGIDLATTRAQLMQSMLEGIAARAAQIVNAMQQDTGLSIQTLRADGGFTNSRAMMQIQADILGKPVEVLANPETTASGVCALAARASGLWDSDDLIRGQVRIARVHEPALPEDQRLAFLDHFDRAIRHLKAWQSHE
jgi:glycerol kinase